MIGEAAGIFEDLEARKEQEAADALAGEAEAALAEAETKLDGVVEELRTLGKAITDAKAAKAAT